MMKTQSIFICSFMLHVTFSYVTAAHPLLCPSNQTQVVEIPGTDITTIGAVHPPTNLRTETASGIFLLPESVSHDGQILRIRAHGDSRNNDSDCTLYLYVLVYRPNEDQTAYDLVYGPARLTHSIAEPGSLPVQHDRSLGWAVGKGDRVGVFIPGNCVNRSDGVLMCPSQVTSNESCHSAYYYHTDGASVNDLDDIPFDNFKTVLVWMNIAVNISANISANGDGGYQALRIQELKGVIAGLSTVLILLLIVLGGTLLVYFIVRRVRRSGKYVVSDLEKKPEGEENLEIKPVKSVEDQVQKGEVNMTSKIMDATDVLNQPTNTQQNIYDEPTLSEADADGYTLLTSEEPTEESKKDAGKGDLEYELDHEDYLYCEPFFEPASQEEELIVQLNEKLEITEIPLKELKLTQVLGSGAFGTVYKGLWCRSLNDQQVEEVAVKSMDKDASEEDRIRFLKEAATMAQFISTNIVGLKGVITEKPMMIVLELMNGGDLRHHLLERVRKNKDTFNQRDLSSMLLSYTRQVGLAMICLKIKGYVHRDLAARNVLMSADGSYCKLADFGLSRELHNENFYKAQGGKIPVKWTAPEALRYRLYSHASDVWSYGCILYEIWSLGEKPFSDLSNTQVMKHVASGHRLAPPPGCPLPIYKFMIQSWHPNVEGRPIICEIVQQLQVPDYYVMRWSEEDMKMYSSEARTVGAPLESGLELYKDLQKIYLAKGETEKDN